MPKQTIEVEVPDGWRAVGYRKPKMGERYLSSSDGEYVKATFDHTSAYAVVIEQEKKYRQPTAADINSEIEVTWNVDGDGEPMNWVKHRLIGFDTHCYVVHRKERRDYSAFPFARIIDTPSSKPAVVYLNEYPSSGFRAVQGSYSPELARAAAGNDAVRTAVRFVEATPASDVQGKKAREWWIHKYIGSESGACVYDKKPLYVDGGMEELHVIEKV